MKLLGKRSVASVLRGFLTFFYWLGFVLILFALIGVTAELIKAPGDMRVNSFDDYSVLYRLDGLNDRFDGLVETDSDITDKVELMPMGILHFETGNRGYIALTGLSIFIYLALFMIVVIQLRGFFTTVTEYKPFVRRNARRIRIIGLAFIIGGAVKVLYSLGFYFYLRETFRIEGASLYLEAFKNGVNLDSVLLGVVVLVIAEIFNVGAKLQEEQALTV